MKVKKTESMQRNPPGADAIADTKPETNGEPPVKRAKLLPDESDDEDPGSSGPEKPALKINEEFAKRFEHNKKREEMHRRELFFLFVLSRATADDLKSKKNMANRLLLTNGR
jgi:protein KRI1